jgi:hypothetical protein
VKRWSGDELSDRARERDGLVNGHPPRRLLISS